MTETWKASLAHQICSFVERVERIDEEIKALNEGKKEVFAERSRGEGFWIVKGSFREILRLRKQNEIAERRRRWPSDSGHDRKRRSCTIG